MCVYVWSYYLQKWENDENQKKRQETSKYMY